MDTARQLLARSGAAIDRFERANADGNPAELAEARTALGSRLNQVHQRMIAAIATAAAKLEASLS